MSKKVLILPKECNKVLEVRLPDNKDGQPKVYFYDEENLALLELVSFSDEHRSWFLDNDMIVPTKENGDLVMATKVDPLFIFLPLIMQYADSNFHNLQDICTEFNSKSGGKFSRIDYALSPSIMWTHICDTQEIDGELFVKFNKKKTIDWLIKKHKNVMKVCEMELEKPSLSTLISYANDFICTYLPASLAQDFKTEVRNRHMK